MSQYPQILIAEDDFEDRFILSSTFSDLGYEQDVELVEDGVGLIEYLDKRGSDEVKLIILDLNMPRLNGAETLAALKNDPKYKGIPVIFFSTSVNEADIKLCMQNGAQDYIAKPARYSEYINTCQKFYQISQGIRA